METDGGMVMRVVRDQMGPTTTNGCVVSRGFISFFFV